MPAAKPKSHADIIDAIGVAEFRTALGITDSHTRTMRARNSIPVKFWSDVEKAAVSAGIKGVSVSVLAALVGANRA